MARRPCRLAARAGAVMCRSDHPLTLGLLAAWLVGVVAGAWLVRGGDPRAAGVVAAVVAWVLAAGLRPLDRQPVRWRLEWPGWLVLAAAVWSPWLSLTGPPAVAWLALLYVPGPTVVQLIRLALAQRAVQPWPAEPHAVAAGLAWRALHLATALSPPLFVAGTVAAVAWVATRPRGRRPLTPGLDWQRHSWTDGLRELELRGLWGAAGRSCALSTSLPVWLPPTRRLAAVLDYQRLLTALALARNARASEAVEALGPIRRRSPLPFGLALLLAVVEAALDLAQDRPDRVDQRLAGLPWADYARDDERRSWLLTSTWLRIEAHLVQGRWEAAEALLVDRSLPRPSEPAACLLEARQHLRQGDRDEALRLLRLARSRRPETPLSRLAIDLTIQVERGATDF